MEAYRNLADVRLIDGCIYCGNLADTRDHVPSKLLLDDPKPDNLPVVGACKECNNKFSRDEEYLTCLIECAVAGSTDPSMLRRTQVAKMLCHSPSLRAHLEAARSTDGCQTQFLIDSDRVRNVVLKLARGHAAFELSQVCRHEPALLNWQPLELLDAETREAFEAPHIVGIYGEVGCRAMQRMMVVEVALESNADGSKKKTGFVVNDWIDVQEGRYRYIAIDDVGGIEIRLVIGEYLACIVHWPP